jgi:hypothetical protein
MKKHIFGLSLLAFSLLLSCGGDGDDTPIENTAPEIEGIAPSEITTYYANTAGEITNDGGLKITKAGICWSKNENPDLDDTVVETADSTNSFTAEIYGLEANTTYYVRAFATNAEGTTYSDQMSFTTPEYNTFTTSDNRTVIIANQAELFNGNWSDKTTITNATDKENGKVNTDVIAALEGEYVAKYCDASTRGGNDDWYLPAYEELRTIYRNREKYNLTFGIMWSSTEDANANGNAYMVDFTGGSSGGSKIKTKYNGQCLCVRNAD